MVITAGNLQAKVKNPIKEKIAAMTEDQKRQRAEEIKHRVYEIKEMDRSKLTKEDRRALRHELRDLKKEEKANEGIYLSIGAIIIIILLLILIL